MRTIIALAICFTVLVLGVTVLGIIYSVYNPKAEITTSIQVGLTGAQLTIENTGSIPITYTFTVQVAGIGQVTRSVTVEPGARVTIQIP